MIRQRPRVHWLVPFFFRLWNMAVEAFVPIYQYTLSIYNENIITYITSRIIIRSTPAYRGECIDYKQSVHQIQGQMNHSSSFGHYAGKVKDPGSSNHVLPSFSPPATIAYRTFYSVRIWRGRKRGRYLSMDLCGIGMRIVCPVQPLLHSHTPTVHYHS